MSDLNEIIEQVETLQKFVPSKIAREQDLGRQLAFNEAVEPVERITAFFRQIPVEHIKDLSASARQQIKNVSNDTTNLISEIMSFNTAIENPSGVRADLISRVQAQPDRVFDQLQNVVSYLASRQRDFSSLADEARVARDQAVAEAEDLRIRLSEVETEANRIIEEVRKTAAEQGVSQQARYFQGEAEKHEKSGAVWLGYTVKTAVGLAVVAVASLWAGFSFLQPQTPYEAFQLGLSKVLIFSTIAYMLFLCARTLMAHRHNEVVNRHRQNALLTFNAFVEAASSEVTRDTVLNHASACVFAPQDSGFTKGMAPPSASPVVEVLPKVLSTSL